MNIFVPAFLYMGNKSNTILFGEINSRGKAIKRSKGITSTHLKCVAAEDYGA